MAPLALYLEVLMDLFEAIYGRRSVREFAETEVTREQLMEVLKAASWAPSGLNNQPWRFAIVTSRDKLDSLAGLTTYRRILERAPAAILVYCDRGAMYNDTKDHQAMGAAIQNLLLAAHALGLGAVWLGEILKNSGTVNEIFSLTANLELMAVIAIGSPVPKPRESRRKELKELLLGEW
jgi:nitroreductase